MANLVEYDNGTEIRNPESFEKIRSVLDEIKVKTFVKGYKASDAEALGMLLSKWFRWDGVQILESAYIALEDSNFHTENKQIAVMLEKLRGDEPKEDDR